MARQKLDWAFSIEPSVNGGTDERIGVMSERRCSRGEYPCPKCGSRETGTDTIATSGRWITFHCDICGHDFRKSAANVSGLSRRLRGLSGAAVSFMKERDNE